MGIYADHKVCVYKNVQPSPDHFATTKRIGSHNKGKKYDMSSENVVHL